MTAPQKPEMIVRGEGTHWRATVLRGRTRLYITPDAKTEQEARDMAQRFIEELRS